ncbi:MAG: hypothetical protein JRI74_05960 [Deltaproteobacteria bacterium]|nr:hypothetical protein [Deltaproteobacteria bacterium]
MTKRHMIQVLFLTLFLSSTSSFAFEPGARGIYGFPSLDGSVQVDEGGVVGTTILFNEQACVFNSLVDFCYQYDFMGLENVLAGFSLGRVIQVKYLDGNVNLSSTGIDETEDFARPVPLVSLNLHVGVLADILEARVRGTGITYSGKTLYEVAGEISFTPVPFLDIHGGYKFFDIAFDEEDVSLNHDMAGPYLAMTVSF